MQQYLHDMQFALFQGKEEEEVDGESPAKKPKLQGIEEFGDGGEEGDEEEEEDTVSSVIKIIMNKIFVCLFVCFISSYIWDTVSVIN